MTAPAPSSAAAPVQARGAAAVALVAALPPVERRAVLGLRLWLAGAAGRETLVRELGAGLDPDETADAAQALQCLLSRLLDGARRPLCRRAAPCAFVGADEMVVALGVAAAAAGDTEDATALFATLVRLPQARAAVPDAERLGLALARAGGDLPLPGLR